MTGLVILLTGVWDDSFDTRLDLGGDPISYVAPDQTGRVLSGPAPEEIFVEGGIPVYQSGDRRFSWQNVPVEQFWIDQEREVPFSGRIRPGEMRAVSLDGTVHTVLYGDAPRTGAVLTMAGFERGLDPFGLGWLGRLIVILSVLLFAISTSIAWSYYGDRCANYLFGSGGILPYKAVFVIMHFIGAVVALETIWIIGDVALGLVTFPNLIALVLLSGVVVQLTKSYFERKPWLENAEVHQRIQAERRATREARKADKGAGRNGRRD
jgi:alanine or glycine:cation symporter, AGCS family